MAIDKSLKQHYAMQGKIRNYLGKQKMVKAPVKWKSGPDHPDTELAYITKAEKDLILKADLHDSLSNGPNKGPSGIISLNSAGGSYGSPGSGTGRDSPSGVGYGGGKYSPGPARGTGPLDIRQGTTPKTTYRDPDPVKETVAGDITKKESKIVDPYRGQHDWEVATFTGPLDIRQGTTTKVVDTGPKGEEAFEMVGGVKVPLSMRGVKGVDPREDPERYFEKPKIDPFEVPEGERTIEQKLEIEKWETAQDWDKVKDLADRGHDFEEIQSAMDKGLLTKTDPQSMKTGLLDRGIRSLRNIIPETRLEKSLLGGLKKSFAPTTGGMFDLKKMASGALKSYGMKKLGLGWLNPYLGLASLFGFNPFKGMQTSFAKTPKKEEAIQKEIAAYNKKAWETAQAEKSSTSKGLTGLTTSQKIAMGEIDLNKLIAGENEFKDIEGQQAGLKDMSTLQIKDFNALDLRDKMEKSGIEIPDPLNNEEKQRLENLRKLRESKVSGSTGTAIVAHGGRIGKPLTGRSRYL